MESIALYLMLIFGPIAPGVEGTLANYTRTHRAYVLMEPGASPLAGLEASSTRLTHYPRYVLVEWRPDVNPLAMRRDLIRLSQIKSIRRINSWPPPGR